jgi:hypothetical protein
VYWFSVGRSGSLTTAGFTMLVLYLAVPVLVLFFLLSTSSTMLIMSSFSVPYLSTVGITLLLRVPTLLFFLVMVLQLRGLHCCLTGTFFLLGITILVYCTRFFSVSGSLVISRCYGYFLIPISSNMCILIFQCRLCSRPFNDMYNLALADIYKNKYRAKTLRSFLLFLLVSSRFLTNITLVLPVLSLAPVLLGTVLSVLVLSTSFCLLYTFISVSSSTLILRS